MQELPLSLLASTEKPIKPPLELFGSASTQANIKTKKVRNDS